MNGAIGNALLFKLAIIFTIILSSLFISSLAYSKAYKVKNKIIEEIEKQGEYSKNPEGAYAAAQSEILAWLNGVNGQGIGYKKNNNKYNSRCTQEKYASLGKLQNTMSDYSYCVYLMDTCNENTRDKCGVYYHVIAYMYVDFPLIEEFPIPIHGETMTFIKKRS